MISQQNFINQSLELNLFFLRIMKEHSIFLEASFTPKNQDLIAQAGAFKNVFTQLLFRTISLSESVISSEVLKSNEIVTKYTMDAEKATQSASGIIIDSRLTAIESSLSPGNNNQAISVLTEHVYTLNHHCIEATNMIIKFKTKLKNDVLSCKLYTTAYPALINHIINEAISFRDSLTKLQNGAELYTKKDLLEEEVFWDDKMADHSYTIRGLLDPTEVQLFKISDNFGKDFDALKKEASNTDKSSLDLFGLTNDTLDETIKIRDFKAQATEGLLDCKIKSIIIPLLADHILRETNHYINILKPFSSIKNV